MRLTDSQWGVVAPLISEPQPREGRGRPRCDSRPVLEGVLWVLQTGAAWKDLPRRYPSHQTCHRRYLQWREDGRLERVLVALADDLRRRGGVHLAAGSVHELIARGSAGDPTGGAARARRGPRPWQQRTAFVFSSPLGTSPRPESVAGKRRPR